MLVVEHVEQGTGFAVSEADHGCVVAFPFRAFFVVVGGVFAASADGAERCEEQSVVESPVSSA